MNGLSELLVDAAKMQEAVLEATLFYEHLEPLGQGATRKVWADSDWVYKLPLANHSLAHNSYSVATQLIEGGAQKLGITGAPLAKAELVWYKSVPVVKMERVVPLDPKSIRANGKAFQLSRVAFTDKQIGTNKAGELVAYDYGNWRPSQTHLASFVFSEYGIRYDARGIEYRVKA